MPRYTLTIPVETVIEMEIDTEMNEEELAEYLSNIQAVKDIESDKVKVLSECTPENYDPILYSGSDIYIDEIPKELYDDEKYLNKYTVLFNRDYSKVINGYLYSDEDWVKCKTLEEARKWAHDTFGSKNIRSVYKSN